MSCGVGALWEDSRICPSFLFQEPWSTGHTLLPGSLLTPSGWCWFCLCLASVWFHASHTCSLLCSTMTLNLWFYNGELWCELRQLLVKCNCLPQMCCTVVCFSSSSQLRWRVTLTRACSFLPQNVSNAFILLSSSFQTNFWLYIFRFPFPLCDSWWWEED